MCVTMGYGDVRSHNCVSDYGLYIRSQSCVRDYGLICS